MTDPTPLTPQAEALLGDLAYVDGGITKASARFRLEAIEAAVTARVLADVAARLPEALKALALASNLGADYDADSILEALRNA